MTANSDRISDSSVKQTATSEFASLPLARAYIATVREEISSLGTQQLIGALLRLRRAYQEFPELELDRPRRDFSDGLQSAVEHLPDRARSKQAGVGRDRRGAVEVEDLKPAAATHG